MFATAFDYLMIPRWSSNNSLERLSAQLLKLGLLLNFNTMPLSQGIRRVVLSEAKCKFVQC